jgi:hypothetical protein
MILKQSGEKTIHAAYSLLLLFEDRNPVLEVNNECSLLLMFKDATSHVNGWSNGTAGGGVAM